MKICVLILLMSKRKFNQIIPESTEFYIIQENRNGFKALFLFMAVFTIVALLV